MKDATWSAGTVAGIPDYPSPCAWELGLTRGVAHVQLWRTPEGIWTGGQTGWRICELERQAKNPTAQRLLLACWYLKVWNESQTKIASRQLALNVRACLRAAHCQAGSQVVIVFTVLWLQIARSREPQKSWN